ncbi:MAG: hypothetical protein E4H20_12540 [Spirochaetales bacterium]|nr:MAG: hypothetical protein E4H20_12540 [Spirochaetales bacterium]
MDIKIPVSRHVFFILSLALIVAGSGILLLTTGIQEQATALWPLLVFAAAILYSYVGLIRKRYTHTFYVGFFIAVSAILHLVAGLLELKLADYWPLFVVIAGLCMIPSGILRYHRAKATYLVPAAGFVFLGGFFSVFSFGFSSMRFKSFLAIWWPTLLVAAGVMLFVFWLFSRALPHQDEGTSGKT